MCLVAFEECPHCAGGGELVVAAGDDRLHEWAETCSQCDHGVVMVVHEYCSEVALEPLILVP